MKYIYSITSLLSLLQLLLLTSSCNRYIDQVTSVKIYPIRQGSIAFYPDSNVLVYKTNIRIQLDSDIYMIKPFYTKLPKGLKWYSIGLSSFEFYYPNKQAIAVDINYYDNAPVFDTSYVPTESELQKIIDLNGGSIKDKYSLSKITVNSKRKQLIIKKGTATILCIWPKIRDTQLSYIF